MSKRRKVYRFLCLVEDTLSVFRKWYERFTPEWEEEEDKKKAEREEDEEEVDEVTRKTRADEDDERRL